MDISLDHLDKAANDVFTGRVVRKHLVRQVKVGANVPVYVLEFLLGKYCAWTTRRPSRQGWKWCSRRCGTTSSGPTSRSLRRRG